MKEINTPDVGCLLIGEYLDEAELPPNQAFHFGEAVATQFLGTFADERDGTEEPMVFTVLLKDGRSVAVRGHGLRQLPSSSASASGSFGVVMKTAGEDVLVALFKDMEVIGIFHGELRLDRKSA